MVIHKGRNPEDVLEDVMRRLLSALVLLSLLAGPTLAAYGGGRAIGEKADDALITAKVKTKLTVERAKNLVSVNVETQDGVVRLGGAVPTMADKAEAERLARSVDGVRHVTNDLKVSEANPAASPGTQPSR
jgi:BON domain